MVNRIILIGNGFDLAHEMPTSYNDFIENFWSNINNELIQYNGIFSSNDFTIKYFNPYTNNDIRNVVADSERYLSDFYKNTKSSSNYIAFDLYNTFLFQISKRSFENWVDIENEYYKILLSLLKDNSAKFGGIDQLNLEMSSIKKHLQEYLRNIQQNFTHSDKIINHIKGILNEPFKIQDFSEESKKMLFNEKWEKFKKITNSDKGKFNHLIFTDALDKELFNQANIAVYGEKEFYDLIRFNQELFFTDKVDFPEVVTFNYTSTESLYESFLDFNVTHIHGQLDNERSPLIFGYGDELDDSYSAIEKLQNNKFLDNMKSINYSKTNQYKHILSIIESGLFQVYILGHSCGNSDRTLLNTIFEHDNCASIKIFYYQDSENSDKYLETYKNISRNFNDKAKLRDRVVNWELSEPLVPFKIKTEAIKELSEKTI